MLKRNVVASLFVSQTLGDDSYSALTPLPDAMGNGPVRSLERAIEIIKEMRMGGLDNPLSISVIGDYCLNAPVEIKDVERITLEPFSGKGRIIGGIKVGGWERAEFNGVPCLRARLPERSDGGAWDFTDLFVNGKRASVTRYPKEGTLEILNSEEYSGDPMPPEHGMWGSSRWITVKPEDLAPVDNILDATVNYNHWWIDEHSPIESYDRESGKLTMAYRSRFALSGMYGKSSSAAKYYLTNVPNMFSSPSEWYLDRKAGIVYYIPRDAGETCDTVVAFAPVTDKLFIIEGKDVKIRGFELTCTRGDYASTHLVEQQKEMFRDEDPRFGSDEQSVCGAPGAIYFGRADRCAIENCSIHGVGVHAIEIGQGCRHIRIENNEIYDVCAGGIKIEGGEAGCDGSIVTSDCIIRKNHIHDCGKRYEAGCGILVMHASNNEIAENEIHDLAYSGISVGWVWGYADSSTYGNIIRANHVYNIGNGSLSDMGGIYTLGRQSGTVISENRIHDVKCLEYGAWGIYLDEGSSNITVEKNVVWGTGKECIHIHWGTDNTVRNNIFLSERSAAATVSIREWHHPSVFERNIMVTRGQDIVHGRPWDCTYHDNIMFDIGSENTVVYRDEEGKCFDVESWQESFPQNCGNVIKDPGIMDVSNGDFRLSDSSVVKEFGFENTNKKG
ncbi:MAG: right-handed parallel beta-helix repeat-containing protein [Ruminococcaceae bacterium]|nr:right-handed parallel beta-helix repeat-containing protein [Oscillospiraceae bacterium]